MKRTLLSLLLLLCVAFAPAVASAPRANDKLEVFVLDIGQGDSTLIVSPTGKIVLVDTGDTGNGGNITGAIRHATGGECRIDLFVVSHPHSDHMGSAVPVMKACKVATVLDSGYPHTTVGYEKYLKAVEASGARYIKAEPGQDFDMGGGAKITVLAPSQPYFKQSELRSGANPPNANSVVMRLDHGEFSMLFTGDAEAETEARMMEKGASLKADVLKVGHHGSRYATSEEFLKAVNPDAATISCGSVNKYGHPTPEALKRLKGEGVKVYRTDLQGVIRIVSDGERYRIHTQRQASVAALFRGRRPR
jgi:competence protein ComEC